MPDFLLQVSPREIIEVATNDGYGPVTRGNINPGQKKINIPKDTPKWSDFFIRGKRTIYYVGIPF